MKNVSWFLWLFILSAVFPVNAQDADPDFCAQYSTNTRCQLNIAENESDSSDSQFDADASEIVNKLSLELLEEYLNEMGYTNVTRYKDKNLKVVMEGRTCYIYVSESGTGMSLSTSFLKEDLSLEDLNGWNKSLRYSLAYVYDTKNQGEIVIFETTLVVSGGVTKERIKNVFKAFPLLAGQFNQYILDLPK